MNTAVEEDVAASRVVEIFAENEAFDQGGDAIELGFVSEGGDVHARRRDLLRAQEVEYEGEEFRVAVDEDRPRVVLETRNSTGEQGTEEGVGTPRQRVPGSRKSLSTHVQMNDLGRLRTSHF